MPQPDSAISTDNADQVVQLARLGNGRLTAVAWSPDGKTLAVSGSLGISLYDGKTLQALWFIESGIPIESVAYSPDGGVLVSGGSDNTVRLWDASSGGLLRTLEGHKNVVYSPLCL